jgi:hypothetical protein
MEITKTFSNTFGDMMRAKIRWFLRRSVLRYAVAVALITYGLHGRDTSLGPFVLVFKASTYFIALCAGVLVLHVVAAAIQSRRFVPRTVTFTENEVIVKHRGEIVTRNWDWIIAAEDSQRVIALLVHKMPRLELYLPKAKLDQNEYKVLRGWLVAHGKLSPKANVA